MRGGTGRNNAYYQGYASAMCMVTQNANPFTDTKQRDLWDEGWLSGSVHATTHPFYSKGWSG